MNYILQLVELWRDGRATTIEQRAEVTRKFNQAIKDSLGGTVWVSGCQRWYLDANGNPAMWPWSFERFRAEMARPQLAEFDLRAPGTATATTREAA